MSTQLDPVTGAPLLTPDLGNIDQLPYKVQPVPLADQTNQPQLGRAYLYPDDVPPVLANINAMNGNQQDQAQTLHTDGNHALNVAVTSGGGGSPPNLIKALGVQQDQRRFNTGTGGSFTDISAIPTSSSNKIFGVSYYAAFIVDGTSRTGTSFMSMAGNNGDPANFFIWGDNQSGTPNLPTGSLVVIKDTMMFPWPLSIPDVWPRSDHIYINAQCSYPQFSFEASLIAGF